MPRARLNAQIWKMSNEVRGAIEGWDFKIYVLGLLFYRFISEDFSHFMQGDENIDYAALPDDAITPEIKDDAIRTKGYFIYPSQLFAHLVTHANIGQPLNETLAATFTAIENSSVGFPSEPAIRGLFVDFDTRSNRLGTTGRERSLRLATLLKGVAALDFGNFQDSGNDIFGDIYEFLISNYSTQAGKSGGEFYTPACVSRLVAALALYGQTRINKIYDPTCGSGSLLLQAKQLFDAHCLDDGFFGQEINHTSYNLARMNMMLHGVDYTKFNIRLGDTLTNPAHTPDKPFDAIVANPPYSIKWAGSDNPALLDDARFAPAGVLAPKSRADLAFVLHALDSLSEKGRAAIVCFPGIFYRGGAEKKIRQYLIDKNYVEAVIALPQNLFFSTTIAVTVLVLSKHKPDRSTQFIDASHLFKKDGKNNILTDDHINQIVQAFAAKSDISHFAKSVANETIAANNYNLSVSAYVDTASPREEIDIDQIEAQIATEKLKRRQQEDELDAFVADLKKQMEA